MNQNNTSNTSPSSSPTSSTDIFIQSIPPIIIDEGIFKYVHILVLSTPQKHLIRGTVDAEYHAECAADIIDALSEYGVDTKVLGGGRMQHNSVGRTLHIYGFSYQYGMADHVLVADMLREYLGEGYTISTSNDGY